MPKLAGDTIALRPPIVKCQVDFYAVDSARTYDEVKAQIVVDRKKLYTAECDWDSVGSVFCHNLLFKIIPYWYGTPWTFEGHTAQPRVGTVACGYFVSTTLQHTGLVINRYKLAQQLPVHEAQTLALEDSVIVFESSETSEIIDSMIMRLSDGIYFLGFDQSHVGYLYITQGDAWIIHSNYVGLEGVVAEPAGESSAFNSFRKFYVAPISNNKSLMRAWINQTEIEVIEG